LADRSGDCGDPGVRGGGCGDRGVRGGDCGDPDGRDDDPDGRDDDPDGSAADIGTAFFLLCDARKGSGPGAAGP
jgi:hypothetical protein